MSNILDDDARERAKKITALAEPVAILLISMIVGTLVIGIVLAMTSLYQFEI
jgi:type II secretory pathway component PulF